MFEERKPITLNRRSSEQQNQDPVKGHDQERRAVYVQRMILIGAVLAVVAIVSYVSLYLQTGAWQVLVDVASLLLGVICLIPAFVQARRGKLDAAGYWILLVLVIVYGVGELLWADATWPLLASIILLAILVGITVRPRRWGVWFVIAVLYGTYVFLINQFEPLPRYPILELSPATQLVNIPLAMLVLWQAVRAVQIGTIRTRLLVAFILVALLPVAIVSVFVVVRGILNNQQAVIHQLESVATLKEAAIDTLLETLQTDLAAMLAEEDVAQYVRVLLQETPDSELYQDAYDKLQTYFASSIERTQRFEDVFLLDAQGHAILSTDATQEGKSYSGFTFFLRGMEGAQAHLTRELGQIWLDSVHPVVDSQGRVLGILTGRADLTTLTEIMLARTGLGDTGETYLVNAERAVLTPLSSGERIPYMSAEGTYATITGERANGSDLYANYQDVPVIGVYHWLPDLYVVLVTEQHQAEAFRDTNAAMVTVAGTILVTVLVAVFVSLILTRGIANPLSDLTETAAQIASGDLERMAGVERQDEIGKLAQAFNSMTVQLRELIGGLEQRVAERTRELEQRSAYMEASAEVGRAVSSILDVDQLIQQVVELIRERFGLYYVGLFLTDEAGEWAILRAGTGGAGKAMLARGHRLKIGLEGMIGWSIANAKARVALYAEEDIVRKVTAELPETRSEAALPLRSRGRVLGALTIQHDQFNAFDDDTIAVLQTMADQVAVALDNANLFTESQAALDATRRIYSELRREAWSELLRTQLDLGYRSHAGGVAPAGDVWRADAEQALQEGKTIQGNGTGTGEILPLSVPIKVRDDVIGVLDTHKLVQDGEWTSDEISLLETLAEQLGEALESARLYQDTQRRAARERLTREITDKMRRATSVEGIVRVAVDELFDIMKTSRAFVRLETASSEQDTGKSK